MSPFGTTLASSSTLATGFNGLPAGTKTKVGNLFTSSGSGYAGQRGSAELKPR